MKCFRRLTIAAVFLTAALVFGIGPALAGEAYDDVYENEIDENTDLSADDIEAEELRAFVEAANEIQEIREDYAERIIKGGDEWYEDLRSEANNKMVAAIEDAGLDEETYRGIAYHVNEDEELLSDFY